jgi:hypothetical protein
LCRKNTLSLKVFDSKWHHEYFCQYFCACVARSVPPEQRSVGLGLQWMLLRTLGNGQLLLTTTTSMMMMMIVMVHKSILLNAHGAWPMFRPVFRRCSMQEWDWSGALFHNLVIYAHTEIAGSLYCVFDVLHAYTHWISVYHLIWRTCLSHLILKALVLSVKLICVCGSGLIPSPILTCVYSNPYLCLWLRFDSQPHPDLRLF